MFINKKLHDSILNTESIVDKMDYQSRQNMEKINMFIDQITGQIPKSFQNRIIALSDQGFWDLNGARDCLELIIMKAHNGITQTICHNKRIVEIKGISAVKSKTSNNKKNTNNEVKNDKN